MRDGLAAGRGPADEPAHRLEAELGELVLGDDQAGGGGVVLLAGVAGGDDAVLLDRRAACRALSRRGVGADALVAVEDDRVALLLRHGDRAPARRRTCRPPRPRRRAGGCAAAYASHSSRRDLVVAWRGSRRSRSCRVMTPKRSIGCDITRPRVEAVVHASPSPRARPSACRSCSTRRCSCSRRRRRRRRRPRRSAPSSRRRRSPAGPSRSGGRAGMPGTSIGRPAAAPPSGRCRAPRRCA